MKPATLSRRRWLGAAAVTLPLLAAVDAFWIEPRWLKVRTLRLSQGKPSARFIHFSDLHHKGAAGYLKTVVARINALSPEFVCFTGDIIEDAAYLPEALGILKGIRSPLYGVPGNHDHWSEADFDEISRAFAATGGEWLVDQQRTLPGGKLHLTAIDELPSSLSPKPGGLNLLLMHYPAWADQLGDRRFDVVLAGHSHGGQVRLPLLGPLVLPYATGKYDLGLHQTPAGPLYVSSGIGHFFVPVRFNCPPEITLIEL